MKLSLRQSLSKLKSLQLNFVIIIQIVQNDLASWSLLDRLLIILIGLDINLRGKVNNRFYPRRKCVHGLLKVFFILFVSGRCILIPFHTTIEFLRSEVALYARKEIIADVSMRVMVQSDGP